MTTLTDLTHPGIAWEPNLDLEDPVPVLCEAQAQGDIYVIPDGHVGAKALPGAGDPLGDGVDVIEGQGIRNPHTIVDLDGDCRWIEGTTGYRFDVGTLIVPRGAACFLIHPEHGGNGIGPGRYVIRRQREQAEEQRAVAD